MPITRTSDHWRECISQIKTQNENTTKTTLDNLNGIGYEAEAFLIDKGTNDLSDLVEKIRNKNYGGIVIGNGIRGLASNFILFEKSST